MPWFCTEVRDLTALEQLVCMIETESAKARASDSFNQDVRLYIAPHKNAFRLYFNREALQALPVLGGLAYEPCDPPHQGEHIEPLVV